jgi:LuxR family maltose regulon positive regulatory protein
MGGGAGDGAHAREALELAERRGWSGIPQTTCAHVALAVAAVYDLRLEEAREHVARATACAAPVRRRNLDFIIAVLAARLAVARGTPAEGLRRLDEFEALHRRGPVPPYERPALAAQRAALLAASGELDAAEAALADVRDAPWLLVDVARAEVQLARGTPADALATLIAGSEKADTHVGSLVEQAVLEAVAHDAMGEPEQAGRALERALGLAEGSRHHGPFLNAGRRMERLLRRQVREGTAHRAVVAELLEELADRDPASRTALPLLEPLSKREQAVLRYLPTPLSNQEIADELFVTTNTVKTHLRSIYRKLGVARRREAVERARDLRLLSAGAPR